MKVNIPPDPKPDIEKINNNKHQRNQNRKMMVMALNDENNQNTFKNYSPSKFVNLLKALVQM